MKRILALETSVTIQKFFRKNTDSNEYEINFAENFGSLMNGFIKEKYDEIIVNADFKNPDSYSVVNLIKSYEKGKQTVVALYSDKPCAALDYAKYKCSADKIFILQMEGDSPFVELKTEDSELPAENSFDSKNQAMKTAMVHSLLSLTKHWESCNEVCQEFLNTISYYCQIPLCAIFLKQTENLNFYVLSCESIAEKDKLDFQKVSYSDFQETFEKEAGQKYWVWQVEVQNKEIEKFYEAELPLSSYRLEKIYDSNKNVIGTLHIAGQGNLSKDQIDLIQFCLGKAGFILESALMLEKKLFFEKRIRKAFSRFVPEQIIDELVASSDKTDKIAVGEKREVAVLFSDIRSFTNISERNKPEVIVAFLNRYFSIMCDIIKKHGGTVDKFIGDAIMALFGAPVSYEDNARRAVAAAYEMREALPSVPLEDLVLPEGMKFDFGIGINYGDLIVGSIGSKEKTDYSVIGDNVNLASRLEGLTKTYGAKIIVSQSVKDDIQDQKNFTFRYLDDVKVKGKAVAVPIYSIDKNDEEFSAEYKSAYYKGMELYKQGLFAMAKDYFEQALTQSENDKATKLMITRCEEFIANPPENWDGGFEFHTK